MLTKLLASLAFVACTLLALGAPASAGENLHVEVNKVVVGSAPAGTTYTVHYACTGGGPSGDLTFNATGDPVPANDNFFNANVPGTTCTITETGTGGATTVAYRLRGRRSQRDMRAVRQRGHVRLAGPDFQQRDLHRHEHVRRGDADHDSRVHSGVSDAGS